MIPLEIPENNVKCLLFNPYIRYLFVFFYFVFVRIRESDNNYDVQYSCESAGTTIKRLTQGSTPTNI